MKEKVYLLILFAFLIFSADCLGPKYFKSPLKARKKSFEDPIINSLKAFSERSLRDQRESDEAISQSCNYTWNSWLNGPPCPQRSLIPVQLNPDSTPQLKKALSQASDLGELLVTQLAAAGFKVGTSLVIVQGNTTLLNKSYGTVNDTKGAPEPTADTIYQIGSVTKIFTTLLMYKLQSMGLASLEDNVQEFYSTDHPPVFDVRNPFANASTLGTTFRQLATHTSGLPREPPCSVYGNCTEEVVFEYLGFDSFLFPPYMQGHYSNLGVALLGRALARAYNYRTSGAEANDAAFVSYEQLLEKYILGPLVMQSSGFEYTPEVISRQAIGYTVSATNQQVPSSSNTEEMGWAAPCGGLYSSPNDLAEFLKFVSLTNNGFTGGDYNSTVLSSDRVREYLLPGVTLPDGISGYGSGVFEIAYANDYVTLTKGGLTGGFAASIVFVPALQLGIAGVINFDTGSAMDALTAQVLSVVRPAVESSLADLQGTVDPGFPPNYRELLGIYAYNGILFVNISLSADQSSLIGTVNGILQPLVFKWQPLQDNPQQSVTTFMYLQAPSESARVSCFYEQGEDLPGVVSFQQIANCNQTPNCYYASLMDMAIFNIPQSN